MMRPRVQKRWHTLIGLLTVAVWLGAALMFGAAVARADVDPVAGQAIAISVITVCPAHEPVIQRFLAAYAGGVKVA